MGQIPEVNVEPRQTVWQPRPPALAVDTFDLDPQFHIALVASEPLIAEPLAMVFDELGGLFVAEASRSTPGTANARGRIKRLEDTNDDGVFDTAAVYLDGLARPCAVACWDGGLFVLDAPDLLFCRDTNRDGRADRISTVVTGFDVHEQTRPVPLCWGIDIRLHGGCGADAGALKMAGAPNAKPIKTSGEGFALDPRGNDIASDCCPGSYGIAFDMWGRAYFSPDARSLQIALYREVQLGRTDNYVMSGEYASLDESESSIPVFRTSTEESLEVGDSTAGAGHELDVTGLSIYQGDAWPTDYRNGLFVLDSRNNLIHRRTVDDTGLVPRSLSAGQAREFVSSDDVGFRPLQCVGAPDGNMYVLDRYGPDTESPESNAGNEYGRIYRIAPRGWVPETRAMPGSVSRTSLVEMLEHPNAWHRETSARMIYASQDRSLVPSLEMMAGTSTVPHGRIGALYALAGLSELRYDVLVGALSDSEATVRVHALRLAVPRLATDKLLMDNVIALTADNDIRARYEAACHMDSVWLADRVAPLVRLCRLDGADPRFANAIVRAARDVAQPVLRELATDPEYCTTPENAPLLRSLARLTLLSSHDFDVSFAPSLLASLPQDAVETRKQIAGGFVEGAVAARRWSTLHHLVHADGPAEDTMAELIVEARATATDPSVPLDSRLCAIGLLSNDTFDNAGELLAGLIVQSEPVEVQSSAIQSLSRIGRPDMVPPILAVWFNLGPRVRWLAMDEILRNGILASSLLDAVDNGAVGIESLVRWGLLDLAKHPNSIIRNPATRLLAKREIKAIDNVATTYKEIQSLKPSVQNGRALFENNCSQCHFFDGIGYRVGPDLDYMANAGSYHLLKSILVPNLDVLANFYSYTIETNDFQTIAGIIVAEETNSITVHGPGGEIHTITRDNIAAVTCTEQSLMPEGWQDALGNQGLADLIGYLVDSVKRAKS